MALTTQQITAFCWKLDLFLWQAVFGTKVMNQLADAALKSMFGSCT